MTLTEISDALERAEYAKYQQRLPLQMMRETHQRLGIVYAMLDCLDNFLNKEAPS